MSSLPMMPAEREYRRMARYHGKLALTAIELAGGWNLAGERWIADVYQHARNAFHQAARAIRARERRTGQK